MHQTTEENHTQHLVLESNKKVKLKFTNPDVATKELHGRQCDGKNHPQKSIQELFPLSVWEKLRMFDLKHKVIRRPAKCHLSQGHAT